MIRLTKITDYGFVLLGHMAQSNPETLFNARDLANITEIPLPMVSKTLKTLAQGGFVDSRRGVKGGYYLKRSPKDISVAEVISSLEGPIALTECAEDHPTDCVAESNCPVKSSWQLISEAVEKALEAISISDLASKQCTCEIERLAFASATPEKFQITTASKESE